MAQGNAGKGRKAGSKGKRATAREACDNLGVNPFEYMALVVKGDVPCNVCRQRLVTRVKASRHAGEHERNCQSCKGDGWEKLSPDFRGRMAEALGRYLEPQMQSIQHTGPEGGPIQVQVLEALNAGRQRVAAMREIKP